MSDFYALIMAGGSGTRLWPLSRQEFPKQALRLVGDRTMFQHAVDRLHTLLPMENVLVVTARDYVPILAEQVPEIPLDNFIVEPIPRGTAGAIGLAAVHLNHRDPEAIIAVLTADHFIKDVDGFRRALSAAASAASEGHIVTLGIEPDFPSTGFGYIRRRKKVLEAGDLEVFEVEAFVEKPDLPRAKEFFGSGMYSWNSGMFIWQTRRILAEFADQLPDIYEQLQALGQTLGTADYQPTMDRVWPELRKETVDYGIMEKAEDVLVIPVNIGWTDIGDWGAVYNLVGGGDDANLVVDTDYVGIDTTGSLIRGGKKLIATIGLEDLVVVDTEDALLICARDRAQEVKAVVEQLKQAGKTEFL